MANAAAVQILRCDPIGMPEDCARKQLENNTLDLSEYYEDGYPIDMVVIIIAVLCPGLTKVDLTWCWLVTDAAIITLAEHCPGLTSINLRHCDYITDNALVALAEHCPGLTTIHLDFENNNHNITDAGIIALAENCTGLTWITLSGIVSWRDDVSNLSDAAVIALAENCPGLTRIEFSDIDMTDAAVISLAEHCPGLTRIDFPAAATLLILPSLRFRKDVIISATLIVMIQGYRSLESRSPTTL